MADEKFGNWLEGYLLELDDVADVTDAAPIGRARLKAGPSGLLLSVNGSAYLPITTTGTAWVQGGNSFGAPGVLGTNDAQPLTLETGGSVWARLTTGGNFLVGYAAPVFGEKLGASSATTGDANIKATAYLANTTNGNDPGGLSSLAVETYQASGTSAYHEAVNVIAQSRSTGAVSFLSGQTITVGTSGAAAVGAVSAAYGLSVFVGNFGSNTAAISQAAGIYVGSPTTTAARTINANTGLSVQNQGATGITTAIGIDVATQSGAATTNLGIRSLSPVVVGATSISGSESLRVSGGGARVDGSALTVAVSGAVSVESSGGSIQIGNNANAQPINIGTGAAARAITVGNATAGTTLTLRAPTVNVAASTAIQINGSAGTAGQVLTSQGAGSPAIWAAGSSSPLVLVSTTNVVSANTFSISGLNGDADGIYFLEAHLRLVPTGGDGNLQIRPNGSASVYSSVQGFTSGAVSVSQASTSFWLVNPTTFGGTANGAQITINAWIQASSTVATNAFRTISGTSIIMDNNAPRSISSQFGGVWNVNAAGNNLTSLDFSMSVATTAMSGPVSVYKLSR